ncbi:hypothetical protein BGZ95_004174 [Linnemannia exigua]|uniref:ATPase AAA-type core domain-containing protein n=1 Tax=Linnemannia exigua TaxID=604196 RepID=A0AAD4D3Q2_9FUNG|nr:hypothetical protein BGZ95_004174 [Linnemannia exigua]
MHQSEDELIRTFVEHIRIGECSGYGSILRNKKTKNRVESSGGRGRINSKTLQTHKSKSGRRTRQNFVTRDVELSIHVYQLQRQGAVEEYGDVGSGDMDESVMMAHHWTLPCEELEGVWDSLIFEDRLEVKLLEYVYTTILFSDRNVNPHLVSWNRVVLLHGPPGTGKTSLCRGLAQTLGIRLSRRFHFTKLLEINCHSLFSKWFSESGKLVHRMFDQIWRMVDDDDTFVCVLIDVAFIDRADIKMYIGLPPPKAIYSILGSSLNELWRAGIIHASNTLRSFRKQRI